MMSFSVLAGKMNVKPIRLFQTVFQQIEKNGGVFA